MRSQIVALAILLSAFSELSGRADSVAANAINALGLDLLRQTASADSNALLSPFSIQMAMAMACAGADGQTREEMARVLHYPKDEGQVDQSFAALQTELNEVMQGAAAQIESGKQYGITNDPLTLVTANRLFGQAGYEFRPDCLDLLKDTYQSPFEPVDFAGNAAGATVHINDWVSAQTHGHIQNLIPLGSLSPVTRLVLVNALYLKAPWDTPFKAGATWLRPFNLPDEFVPHVRTMFLRHSLGYAHRNGCQEVVIPYRGAQIQFVILLPDETNGLAALEAGLKPETLADCANLPYQSVELYLPKFGLHPPVLSLVPVFGSLGMKSAFDRPLGSANFDRLALRRPDDYLAISDIFHKTWIKLDESGTEAAAATAVEEVTKGLAGWEPPPVQVHVDHPFLFAIQHRASGACLFLGHVTDPR